MQQSGQRKQNIWMPLLFSVVLVIGMLLGYKLDQSLGAKKNISDLLQRNDRLDEIMDLVSSKYVDTLNKDTMYNDAIQGILGHLDPHTFYIPAYQLASTEANLEGKSKGLGFEYFIYQDSLYIISIIPNSPAEKAGLKVGDRVLKINDSRVSGVQITDDDVKQLVGNPEVLNIEFSILTANQQPQRIQLSRGVVPIPSVDAVYMKSATVGYIRLNRFSATTYQEFKDALMSLKKQGMRDLVLDLRDNPGGYVDDAIAILDEMLDGDKDLVKVIGRNDELNTYTAKAKGNLETGRVLVMINEGSASAAEIVAGAIQDWDRGVVIGRKSFGKGLIQEQFELSDGSALRLTIARYFTPSGRPIQKIETLNELSSEEDWSNANVQQDFKNAENYYSLVNKRKLVVEDGGVVPDVSVALPDYFMRPELWKVINMVDAATLRYFTAHINEFVHYDSYQDFSERYEVTNEQLAYFKNAIPVKYIQAVNQVWANPNMLGYVKLKIKANFARLLYRSQGYYKVLNSTDSEVRNAFDIISSEKYNQLLNLKK